MTVVLEHENINFMSKKNLDSYEKRVRDRLGIKNYRVYWRKKTNRIPKNYVVLGELCRDWSGLLNSSVGFIDKLTGVKYKFIIKNDYVYIDKKYTIEDNISRTKHFVSELMGWKITLDKWMIP